MTADADATGTMDLEGSLRFNANALHLAPSGEIVPGTDYATRWQSGVEGRTMVIATACDLLEAAVPSLSPALGAEITTECAALRAATRGRQIGDGFQLYNWEDKPHRLAYDAMRMMEGAADDLASRAAA
jgi:hypothetical protein